jgi:hypothetical protein
MGRILNPAPCTDRLQGERRRHQNLRQQLVGIERDRRQERVECSALNSCVSVV